MSMILINDKFNLSLEGSLVRSTTYIVQFPLLQSEKVIFEKAIERSFTINCVHCQVQFFEEQTVKLSRIPGALEYNLTGRCPFFKNLSNLFKKKICVSIPVSELLDYKDFQKQ